jgi:DNA-binding transcriptional regulator YiaG
MHECGDKYFFAQRLTGTHASCMLCGMDGKKIRSAREKLGESQEDFAKRFGVDQTTLSRWETMGVPARGTSKRLVERVLYEIREQSTERRAQLR